MRVLLSTICLFAVGCHGPLTKPMVDRLDEGTQQKVDDAWVNMLTPPERLDRTLLLDVILSGQLHQFGVDYLRLVSEKHVGLGLVVMEVRYDREDPAFDEFTVTYLDSEGYEVRRERFTREDVNERVDFLFSPISFWEDMDPELRQEKELLTAEREARQAEIKAVLAPLYEDDSPPEDE